MSSRVCNPWGGGVKRRFFVEMERFLSFEISICGSLCGILSFDGLFEPDVALERTSAGATMFWR